MQSAIKQAALLHMPNLRSSNPLQLLQAGSLASRALQSLVPLESLQASGIALCVLRACRAYAESLLSRR